MIRQLCREHYITEFNALPNSRRNETSTWITVAKEDCAECKRLAELQPTLDAQRIEELEADVEGLKGCDATIALLSHQMRAVCQRVGLGVDHALHDCVSLLGNKIDLLQRELHNEQVRRGEWERICEEMGLIEQPENGTE